jgi:hypothetical protein
MKKIINKFIKNCYFYYVVLYVNEELQLQKAVHIPLCLLFAHHLLNGRFLQHIRHRFQLNSQSYNLRIIVNRPIFITVTRCMRRLEHFLTSFIPRFINKTVRHYSSLDFVQYKNFFYKI